MTRDELISLSEQDSYKINDIDSRTEKEAYDRQRKVRKS